MSTVIPQRELRNSNADILNRVQAGESFVVTRNGVAVADVVPHSEHAAPPMFPSTASLTARRRSTGQLPVDQDAWLADIRQIDDVVDDDPFETRG